MATFRCCSYVGRQRRGAQKIALDPGCMQHGILLHELGHVIGFWHEQNRPDRDDYIKVIKNYHDSVRYNFQKLNESQVRVHLENFYCISYLDSLIFVRQLYVDYTGAGKYRQP